MRFSEQALETGSVRQTPNICILDKQIKEFKQTRSAAIWTRRNKTFGSVDAATGS